MNCVDICIQDVADVLAQNLDPREDVHQDHRRRRKEIVEKDPENAAENNVEEEEMAGVGAIKI